MGRYFLKDNPEIEIVLRRSARARRLSLRVSRLDGRVTLTMPKRTALKEAYRFAEERADWIQGHLGQMAPARAVTLGQTLPIEGQLVQLQLGEDRRVRLHGDVLTLPGPQERMAAQARAFVKTLARDRLSAASDRYAAQIGRSYGRLTLRDTRSRWGSCTSEGNLMYSWRLIMAPPAVLDYVAAHEVAHLIEMNHSSAFWQIVADICPDYEDHRHWLRETGPDLHQYQFGD